MFGLLVPKTTKEWQIRLPGDRCYGSPRQRYPLETDRHSELKMAIPNRSQFVSWKYHIPYLSSLSENLSLLVSSLINWSSQVNCPKLKPSYRKIDLLRQSAIQFLKSLFCSFGLLTSIFPLKSSVGLVIVSRCVVKVFLLFPYCSSKSFFVVQKKGSCHSSGVLWGKRCVYVCRRKKKKVLGLARLVQILSEFQSFSTSKKRCPWLGRCALSLSLSPPSVSEAASVVQMLSLHSAVGSK